MPTRGLVWTRRHLCLILREMRAVGTVLCCCEPARRSTQPVSEGPDIGLKRLLTSSSFSVASTLISCPYRNTSSCTRPRSEDPPEKDRSKKKAQHSRSNTNGASQMSVVSEQAKHVPASRHQTRKNRAQERDSENSPPRETESLQQKTHTEGWKRQDGSRNKRN